MPQQQQSETKTAPPISAESERFCQEGLAAYSRFEYDAAIAAYDKALQADGRNYQLIGKGVALAYCAATRRGAVRMSPTASRPFKRLWPCSPITSRPFTTWP